MSQAASWMRAIQIEQVPSSGSGDPDVQRRRHRQRVIIGVAELVAALLVSLFLVSGHANPSVHGGISRPIVATLGSARSHGPNVDPLFVSRLHNQERAQAD